ncbi:hypothetical protein IIC38_09915 [candidate division KSB1 bacterium]|nr:hypothetical protein [candidate division KSB1 bacterium]
MSHTQLSNVQLELLKLYSTDLSEKDLTALKNLLAKFYAERAIQTADQIWEQKKLSNKDMAAWLNEG